MKTDPIRPTIEHHGQPYVDEPVYVEPKPMTELEYAVGRCFNSAAAMALRVRLRVQTGWQRVTLRWITPQDAHRSGKGSR